MNDFYEWVSSNQNNFYSEYYGKAGRISAFSLLVNDTKCIFITSTTMITLNLKRKYMSDNNIEVVEDITISNINKNIQLTKRVSKYHFEFNNLDHKVYEQIEKYTKTPLHNFYLDFCVICNNRIRYVLKSDNVEETRLSNYKSKLINTSNIFSFYYNESYAIADMLSNDNTELFNVR